ncbi:MULTISPECIES: hypothetical protein [Streptomycetaceae]|uniref:hypothetical protein n=1 Tax=Streptomycetaceae TaxID=2062 RepID=UPI00093D8CE5|nr:hypothetical protein [Streptomyces sp. CB02056]OKI06474.1 hypothetical protein AMK13_18035 [Streptomyces sp. CB02056]
MTDRTANTALMAAGVAAVFAAVSIAAALRACKCPVRGGESASEAGRSHRPGPSSSSSPGSHPHGCTPPNCH